MSILSILRAFGGTAIALFWGMGAPNYAMKYSVIQICVLAVLIVPASRWLGLEGVAVAVVVSYLILELLYARRVLTLIDAGWLQFLQIMVTPALASIGMVSVIESIKGILGQGVTGFSLLVFIGIGCYAGLLFAFDAILMASRVRIMFMNILNIARESSCGGYAEKNSN